MIKFFQKLSPRLFRKKVRQPLLLFTPGPLTVSQRVRRTAMRGGCIMHRSDVFDAVLKEIQINLLRAFEVSEDYFPCILTATGRGANEAMIMPYVLHRNPLFLVNGSWGKNLVHIAEQRRRDIAVLEFSHDKKIVPQTVEEFLATHQDINTVIMVHQETRSGILNPLVEIARIAKNHRCTLLVDAMSSAIVEETNFEKLGVDMFTTSSAKGVRSFPGLGIVCGKNKEFESLKTRSAGSYYFDLYAEYESQKHHARVRFAQSVPLFSALDEALQELLEKGVAERRKEIWKRTTEFREWMKSKGAVFSVSEQEFGHAVTTFNLPVDMNYLQFKKKLEPHGIFLLYGDSIEGSQFQISFLGAIKEKEILVLKEALTDVLFS